MYGDNHIKIIEKFDNQPHIKALKNDSHLFCSIIEASIVVLTQYTGITDSNL
jgi:hypothetical protein